MSRSANIKTGLIAIIVLLCGAAVAMFLADRPAVLEPETSPIPANEDAAITIEEFRQSSTRDGRTEWILTAKSARMFPARKNVRLENLTMTFIGEDGKEMWLSAAQGTLDVSTRDIVVRGDIVVRQDRMTLRTEFLQYEDIRRILFSSHQTTIMEDSLHLTADSFFADLTKNRIEFIGHVNCVFQKPSP